MLLFISIFVAPFLFGDVLKYPHAYRRNNKLKRTIIVESLVIQTNNNIIIRYLLYSTFRKIYLELFFH